MLNILNFFPKHIANFISQNMPSDIEEIRIRAREANYIKSLCFRDHYRLCAKSRGNLKDTSNYM